MGANAAAGAAGGAAGEDDDAGGGASSASGSGTGAAGGSFALGQHAIAYCDLPDAAKELDQTLYNILRLNVKGSKNALLSHVTFNSYVQGVIVLHHHINISRMDRIIRAFNQMDKCVFKGSALAFQTEFLGLRRELDVCGATMQHYSLCRLMQSSLIFQIQWLVMRKLLCLCVMELALLPSLWSSLVFSIPALLELRSTQSLGLFVIISTHLKPLVLVE